MGYSNIAAGCGRYMGTVRTTAATGTPARGGVTEDSFRGGSQLGGKRFLWNRYNRVLRHLGVIDTTDTWTYATNAWRSANAAAGNKVEILIGLSLDIVEATTYHYADSPAGELQLGGVGIDSTTVNSAQVNPGPVRNGASIVPSGLSIACYLGYVGIGYHALNWLENTGGLGTHTFGGDLAVSYFQTGLLAKVMV